ncbi:MAG: TPP-dependent 2-oxoacid decarboxylase [Gammaproteobacteria bacterium]|jgi:TPP-dependent 2-oxoacid decarboxylase
MHHKSTLSNVLCDLLLARGIKHVFGIPGDYVLGFFDTMEKSDLSVVNTCDEQGAGFAADAYARASGLGAVCVTYGVGGLKLVNSTAQAYAERSPVVVISGAPGISEMTGEALLHHRVRDFGTQRRIFEEITVAQAILSDPGSAYGEMIRVLNAAERFKRPVYIEIPRDCAHLVIETNAPPATRLLGADPETLAEAMTEALGLLNSAERPIILAGVEIHRFGLQDQLVNLIERSGIRFATTIMGKSVVPETTPGFVGVYAGILSDPAVRAAVEQSDCILNLGAMLTDLNTGIFTAQLDPSRMIVASADTLTIRRHHYAGIELAQFLLALQSAGLNDRGKPPASTHANPSAFSAAIDSKITVSRVFDCLDAELPDDIVVVADPGDALFGAMDLTMHLRSEFISCAYYASLGFAVPASIGLQMAQPQWRPLVLVGDGAFQMTGLELSTAARYQLTPIVVVLDNKGYGTERPMLDGPFNDVHAWDIGRVTQLIGSGQAYSVGSEEEFVAAVRSALADREQLAIIHVHLAADDFSPALRRLTSTLGKRV